MYSDLSMEGEDDEDDDASVIDLVGATTIVNNKSESNLNGINSYLSWRMPPDESHSDYTIAICCPSVKTNYHVHKLVLGIGECKSSYFNAIFSRSNDYAENAANVSTIVVPAAAADAFPIVLDFAYSRGGIFNLETKNASAVSFLADYLDMEQLRDETMAFIHADLTLENADYYYTSAIALSQVWIIQAVEKHLIENVMQVTITNPILSVLTVSSMMEILGSECLVVDEIIFEELSHLVALKQTSFHLSKLVTSFVTSVGRLLTAEDFILVTEKEYLPLVDIAVATTLVQVEETICGTTKNTVTCLKRRCFQSIEENFHQTDLDDPNNEIVKFLSQQPSEVALEFLVKFMKQLKSKAAAAK